MDTGEAFRQCEDTVRQHDPDRYFASLFAPPARRKLLFALYAFNYEISRVAETVREPMMAEIRLQWWREAAEGAQAGNPRAHPVAMALAELFAQSDVPLRMFDALIDARALDAGAELFADMAALEAYADASSGGVMRIAARLLGAGEMLDETARAAGIGFGLTGLLRAIPFHAARNKLYLPLDLVAAAHVRPEEIFAGRGGGKLKNITAKVASRARAHLDTARKSAKPGAALASVLPAAVSPAYLKLMTKPGFDPFTMRADLPVWRKQLAMLRANIRGRI